jgi:hypothetical protein
MADLPLIVFDVNETLLDLGTMEPTFECIFGEKVQCACGLRTSSCILLPLRWPTATSHSPISDRQG